MSWNKNRITELLGIDYPILLGPMGGGFSTVELLAAVSDGGGLGSVGAYTYTPDQIRAFGKAIKAKTDKPYNINLWVSDVDATLKPLSTAEIKRITGYFTPYFKELNIPLPALDADITSKFEQQIEVVFELKPKVFSFIFGVPSPHIIKECKRLGIKLVGSATTLDEALVLEATGVDAIVAAGFESGGHRPSFLRPALDSLTGTFALIQQIKAKVKTPIIAAGGIADGNGIAAAMRLGAEGVQIGTAFLACRESNATDVHREQLFSAEATYTVLSKAMTGRLGRMLRNRITDETTFSTEVLPFPLQVRFLAALKNEAMVQGKADLVNFWCGQFAGNLKHHHAELLMKALIEEANSCFNGDFN